MNSPASDIQDYVRVTARFVALPLSEAQVERVAGHLTRTCSMVAPLLALELPAEVEPPELYCPAPFPEDAA